MRSASRALHWLVLVGLVACGGDDDPGTKAGTDTPTDAPLTDTVPTTDTSTAADSADTGIPTTDRPDPTEPDPCADPLVATVPQPGVLSQQSLRVSASGGLGPYTFSLDTNASGGFVNEVSGDYFAGELDGVTDTVAVVDAACGTTATVDIEVFLPLVVQPATGEIPTETAFSLDIAEGSGAVRCEAQILASNGSLVGCDYTAGSQTGTDTLEVIDELTGQVVDVQYEVVDGDAALIPWGELWMLPQGHPQQLAFLGGTGVVDVVADDPVVDWDGTYVTGLSEGRTELTVTDRFTGQTTWMDVVVSAPRMAPVARDGESTSWDHVVGGDVNGDGYDDAVVAMMDASVQGHLGGGILVYLGGPSGLAPEPAQTFGFDQPYAYGGRSLALGDVDGDGVLDLAYGANGYDLLPSSDVGLVHIHRGTAGGLFESEPTWVRAGAHGGDNFGYGLELCDVDGDGTDDLVVAAFRGEDRDAADIDYDTGALYVYAGNPGGPGVIETAAVYGAVPDAGSWLGRNVGLGHDLEGGDVDGDGRCDVAVSTYSEALADGTDHGLVWVWTADALLAGSTPSRIYTRDGGVDDTSVLFGVDLELGDVDGDGLDDLLVGGRNHDEASLVSAGAAWLFLAGDDDGRDAVEPVYAAEASWWVSGDDSYDYLGWGVDLGDSDGDGFADVWIGSVNDELPKADSNTGTVLRFDGAAVAGSAPGTQATSDQADAAWAPTIRNGFFGTALRLVGDVDGDGTLDLAVSASRDDSYGDNATAVYWTPTDDVPQLLEVPADASSSLLGDRRTMAWVDMDGDGVLDLVGGAWSQPDDALGYNAGQVFTWLATGSDPYELAPDPEEPLAGHVHHSANDRYGQAVATAGDVNGDGYDDLAVVAWNDSKPSSFDPAEVANATECEEQINGAGAVYVHLGGPGGIDPSPAFVAYGYDPYARFDSVAAGDLDGDGYGDLVVGSVSAGSTGGFAVVRGREEDPGGLLTVVCDTEHSLGVSSNSRLGEAVAPLGDLNGDGCDEVAVGADADDLGESNQGSVRVLWGDGPGCVGPAVTTLVPDERNTRAGDALAGGRDADADGVPDLVIGGYDWEVEGDVGAVWFASGAWLATLPRQPAPGWVLPAEGSTTTTSLSTAPRIEGTVPDGELGRGVGLVNGPDSDVALVVIGTRYGDVGGGALGGGVTLWRIDGGAFEAVPTAVVAGESLALEGWLGEGVAGHPDRAVLVVGAPFGHVDGIDRGVVYPFVMDP